MPKNYTLIVTVPGDAPTLYELRGDRIGLGRGRDNQISLKVKEISSSHVEFRKSEDGGYEVVDLDSTNGTRVNGKHIERHRLADGDRLLIGEAVSVHFVELAEGATPADVAVEAGEAGKRAAATYAQMDEKLQSIEADIEEKASELEAMQKVHEAKKAEYEKLAASLRELEEMLAAKKLESGGNSEEVRMLEMDLMSKTRRVEVLRTDLNGQAQQLEQLQRVVSPALTPAVAAAERTAQSTNSEEVALVVPVPMSASPHARAPLEAATPAPPEQPPTPAPSEVLNSAQPVETPLVSPLAPPPAPAAPRTNRLVVDAPKNPKPKPKFGK